MNIPPAILRMSFPRSDGRPFRLWLPLFLLWPLLWLIELLVLVAAVVVDSILLLSGQRYHHFTLLLLRCFGLLGDTRGIVIRVNSTEAHFDMTLV